MRMTRIPLIASLLIIPACSSPEGAVLVDQSRQAAMPLMDDPNPVIAQRATDIVLNTEKLLVTDYDGKLPDDAPKYTKFASAEARTKIQEAHDTSTTIWDLVKSGVKMIPGGEWALTGLAAAYALFERWRKNKWAKLAVSTASGINEWRNGNPDAKVWDTIKGILEKNHIRAGLSEFADKVVTKVRKGN